MNSTPYLFVYVTAPNQEVALKIGRSVVNARLAACANVLGGMSSVYWWQGQLTQDNEVVLILKTHEDRMAELTTAIKAAHPYDTSCIVALPIVGGNADYLNWLRAETLAT